MNKLNLGIVGACGRGASFKAACDALPQVSVHAVCDSNADELTAARERLGAREQYTDYETMLEKSDLDAVIIGTPMHCHVPMAMAALQRHRHVLSEVTAGVALEECRQLVVACQHSRGIYMMAENYTYMRPNVIVRELVRRGLFGTPYYAEGEYIHELKELNAIEGTRPCPFGIHEAMDMTLPGLISQQSIPQRSAWLTVPDSRHWVGVCKAKEPL